MRLIICPICGFEVDYPNRLVNFHISYPTDMYLQACQHCNTVEYFFRTGYTFDCLREEYEKRAERVKIFMDLQSKKIIKC